MNKNYFIIVLALLPALCYGQSFQRYIGGMGNENAESIVQSADGGYFITGETETFGFGQKDFILLKYNVSHDLQWAKTYGTNGNEFGTAVSVLEMQDGNLILTGRREDSPGDPDRALMIKLDADGNILWSKRLVGIGGANADVFSKTIELDNGNLMSLGSSQSVSTGNQDAFIAELTSDGVIVNSLALGGPSPDHALKFTVFDDHLIIMQNGVSFNLGQRS